MKIGKQVTADSRFKEIGNTEQYNKNLNRAQFMTILDCMKTI